MNKDTTTKSEKEIITAPKGTKYLSDIMQELPVNCLFNKGKTGCGGTELVLRGKKNAIIAVPYVNLILNKLDKNSEHEDRRNEILGFYWGIEEGEVEGYIKSHEVRKIIVTYDSLPKLMNIIARINGDERKGFEEYFLLVDEWHCLFKYYEFRRDAIRNLLVIARKFKEVTYMTATPILQNFTLTELKELPVKEVQWEEASKLKVVLYQSNKPLVMFQKFVSDRLKEKQEYNYHVFMNSVEMICDLLEEIRIPTDNCKIVCSGNNEQNLKKLKKINPAYEIAFPDSPAKKLNLYTSTAFEGCDIHDPDGINIIISSAHKEQTMLDVRTTVPQICGRIRDSKYKDTLYYIYNMKKQSQVKWKEYAENAKKEFDENERIIEELNKLSPEAKEFVIKRLCNPRETDNIEDYIYADEDNKIHLDRNLLRIKVYNYHTINQDFGTKDGLEKAFKENNNVVLSVNHINCEDNPAKKLEENPQAKPSIEELFKQYHALKESLKTPEGELPFDLFFNVPNKALEIIEEFKPWIKKTYDILGMDRIKELKFNRTAIERELVRISNFPDEIKLVNKFEEEIVFGQTYTIKQINKITASIAKKYGLRDIDAKKLNDYFISEDSYGKQDGKTIRCKRFIKRRMTHL